MTNTNTSVEIIEKRDKRVWSKYNPSLVNRIDVLLDTSFLSSWNDDLGKENDGKVGHPYEYPQEFFVFLSKVRELWNVPFRELEGFVRKLSELTGKFKPLSYVAIFQRIRSIPISGMIEEINRSSRDGTTVIIDSSGFKITQRGDWLSTKWPHKRKGWLKMHIAIDAERMNVVSLTITDLHTPDTKEFRKLLYPVLGRASSVYGDKGYDSRKNFQYLNNRGVKAVIPTRSNSRSLSRGVSPARGRVVRLIKKIGLEEWKREVNYGKRWRVEIFFSALKRTVGEIIMANKLRYQVQEAVMKIYAYFLMRKNTVVN
jgi:IS5 family transposase